TATTEIYTLSLHDALPICSRSRALPRAGRARPPPRGHRRGSGRPPCAPARSREDGDLHAVPAEVVLARLVAPAPAHVVEVGLDLAAEHPGVVRDHDGTPDELRLERAEVLEVFLFGGVDEREVEARAQ